MVVYAMADGVKVGPGGYRKTVNTYSEQGRLQVL